jgi:purine nucleoside phosphorylase
VNYRANIHALHTSGATHVIALNTVGGISAEAVPGSLWLPEQIIDYTAGRESSFHDGTTLPLQHQEFAEPYDGGLRDLLRRAAVDVGIPIIPRGVYGCTQGPRLETAAEIRRMQRDGCDLVGMTGMPEAALARELGLAYASVSMVVNPAAGLSAEPITLEAILREAEGCMAQCMRLLACAVAAIDQRPG